MLEVLRPFHGCLYAGITRTWQEGETDLITFLRIPPPPRHFTPVGSYPIWNINLMRSRLKFCTLFYVKFQPMWPQVYFDKIGKLRSCWIESRFMLSRCHLPFISAQVSGQFISKFSVLKASNRSNSHLGSSASLAGWLFYKPYKSNLFLCISGLSVCPTFCVIRALKWLRAPDTCKETRRWKFINTAALKGVWVYFAPKQHVCGSRNVKTKQTSQ